ncbi:hypothetical protein U9M48_018953, partial [Paspalum notatum var. saurae]
MGMYSRRHDYLMEKIATDINLLVKQESQTDLEQSKFSKKCKVDYVNNNISECFNGWIKDYKDLPVVDLMDKIRELIMEKIATRQDIAFRLEGRILPSVLHELNMKSRGLHYDFCKSGLLSLEISGTTNEGKTWRYGKNLWLWAMGGVCTHAIFALGKFRHKELKMEDFVDEYYSIERFKLAYQFEVSPMGDKSQWPKNDPGFEMIPPPLERPAGRPRKQRIKASGEPGKRGPYRCKRCFKFGHIEKGCNATQAELEQELPPPRPKKQKKQ